MPKEASLSSSQLTPWCWQALPSCPASCLLCSTLSQLGPMSELEYLAFCASQSSPAPSPLPGEPAGKQSSPSMGVQRGLGQAGRQSPAKLSPAEPLGSAGLRLLAWSWSRNPLPAMKVHEVQDPQGAELPLLQQPR